MRKKGKNVIKKNTYIDKSIIFKQIMNVRLSNLVYHKGFYTVT